MRALFTFICLIGITSANARVGDRCRIDYFNNEGFLVSIEPKVSLEDCIATGKEFVKRNKGVITKSEISFLSKNKKIKAQLTIKN